MTTSAKSVSVDAAELLDAFEFVSDLTDGSESQRRAGALQGVHPAEYLRRQFVATAPF